MSRREFIDCLNSEPKAFNCNFGSLIGGGALLALFGFGKGLFWGIGAGGFGFFIGGWIGKHWHLGYLQRQIYWHFPFADIWINKHTPLSSNRREL